VNCGFCELHCPDFAIVLTPKDKGRKKKTAASEAE
jgi:2-oxoglutarate ferredoxin oxidoreductase subunit delta